jgi:CheY-like chemotaxis protein
MPTALVAEDEMLVRELIIDDLTHAGFAVTAVNTADTALAALQEGAPIDLLFTDIRMPGEIDGWELGRQALELHPQIKVVYATGYSDRDVMLTLRERRIAKPYRYDDVITTLRSLGLMQA